MTSTAAVHLLPKGHNQEDNRYEVRGKFARVIGGKYGRKDFTFTDPGPGKDHLDYPELLYLTASFFKNSSALLYINFRNISY